MEKREFPFTEKGIDAWYDAILDHIWGALEAANWDFDKNDIDVHVRVGALEIKFASLAHSTDALVECLYKIRKEEENN